jgi:rhodanese-related sulfurtransferase
MKQLIAAFFCFSFFISYSQYKADNVKYKTVFAEDLCKTMQDNPGYILLDVRSEGEFKDTLSSSPGLNIGHMQNALNINVNQLPQRWKELTAYKDKPVFIYCYSSQRSRRASKLLADSGFTKIFNINGGLSNFYTEGIQQNACTNHSIISAAPYKIVSAKQLAQSKTNYYIIDLRSDSAFTGKSISEKTKMHGRFSKAINIPFEKFGTGALALPNKPILLVDDLGAQSPVAAKMLLAKGFKDVSILFNGMDEWLKYISNTTEKPVIKWNTFANYRMLSAEEFHKWKSDGKSFRLIDIRPREQFLNQSKNSFQNIGNIKGAVNLPFSELTTMSMPPIKTDPIVLYGFNSENEVFSAAKWFSSQGHRNVYVLQGGIFNLRWASHNLKNKSYLDDFVVNVPAENE